MGRPIGRSELDWWVGEAFAGVDSELKRKIEMSCWMHALTLSGSE